eukprot:scaffold198231_cov27-Tisochrysis_lutea.AAC.1
MVHPYYCICSAALAHQPRTRKNEEPSPTTLITQLALLGIQLADEAPDPDPRKLDKMRELNERRSLQRQRGRNARLREKGVLRPAKHSSTKFFRRFQSKTTNRATGPSPNFTSPIIGTPNYDPWP